MADRAFWTRQRVLLTGHTGFKGSWASLWLEHLGAVVAGYALPPDHVPDLFSMLAPFEGASSMLGDLADAPALKRLACDFRPTIVLHMAAQPLVRRSFADPATTFATNVLGTVNLLEAIRGLAAVSAVLIVTTDKVYDNRGEERRFLETDPLGGSDPYSASKASAELVASSYARSFFEPAGIPVATARAGNVVGGGDWSRDRLVPDIWRALHADKPIELRYPRATRPWQHVLEPLSGYFDYLQALCEVPDNLPRSLNFGPEKEAGDVTVAAIAEALQKHLGAKRGWVRTEGEFPPEMIALALDSCKAASVLGWRPRLDPARTVEWTGDWYRRFDCGEDVRAVTLEQIIEYETLG